jgi:hypothetical protein
MDWRQKLDLQRIRICAQQLQEIRRRWWINDIRHVELFGGFLHSDIQSKGSIWNICTLGLYDFLLLR